MPEAEFEPAITAINVLQTYALDGAATGIRYSSLLKLQHNESRLWPILHTIYDA
jgi:hypothetical protein